MEGRDVFSNIHHRLRGMLQDPEPVLDIPHDLTVILLVLLKELGILFHLVVHLAGERVDLILKRGIQVMEFLLELKKRLEGLLVGRRPPGQALKNPKSRGKAAESCRNRDQNQERRAHGRIIA
jgi:hypothetical protein